jgi:hypothetical protein
VPTLLSVVCFLKAVDCEYDNSKYKTWYIEIATVANVSRMFVIDDAPAVKQAIIKQQEVL